MPYAVSYAVALLATNAFVSYILLTILHGGRHICLKLLSLLAIFILLIYLFVARHMCTVLV